MVQKFLYKLIIFFFAFVFVNAGLFFIVPRPKDHYLQANKDKHALLNSAQSPKIIFVGGSNVPFGLNSAAIEKALHFRVVNMGLSAPLGLRFMLSEVLPKIANGDIVVILPEYEQAFDHLMDGEADLVELIILSPETIFFLSSIRQWQVFLLYYGTSVGRVLMAFFDRRRPEDIYRRSIFSTNGDAVGHLSLPSSYSTSDTWRFPTLSRLNKDFISVLNDFYTKVSSRNASAFLVFPGLPENVYENNKEQLKTFYGLLQSQLTMPILSSPEKYVFPPADIFNNMYHLNDRGIQMKTEKIIEDLRKAIS